MKPDTVPASTPTPAEIRVARLAAGLTQAQAAALVGKTARTWQGWESDKPRCRGRGSQQIPAPLWLLFQRLSVEAVAKALMDVHFAPEPPVRITHAPTPTPAGLAARTTYAPRQVSVVVRDVPPPPPVRVRLVTVVTPEDEPPAAA
jgi:transcriptional regulator with XRE-family HTH domain